MKIGLKKSIFMLIVVIIITIIAFRDIPKWLILLNGFSMGFTLCYILATIIFKDKLIKEQ